jgi:CDP-6-deoxy-D-xylo-4-hexulose-3-dehydrase
VPTTLVKDTINEDDIHYLIEWLKTFPRLTKGKETENFEQKWASWLGTEYAVFVNSGSSAILLMLYALIETGKVSVGDKIVIPALSWATDLSPVIQFNLQPVLCDINLQNLSVDLEHLEQIFKEENPKALILVSVLGLSPNMSKIQELCETYNVILLEDVCESTGTQFEDKALGTFGVMSAFSCYFGHHFSTIEGGLINTNDRDLYNILKMLRSHGWDRDLDKEGKKKLEADSGNEFNNLYRFYVPGFNLRATDLQAYLGINQLDRIDKTVAKRNDNYLFYKANINNDYWNVEDGRNFISNFAFPIIHPKRDLIVKELTAANIEVRPLICGSMGTQPMYTKRFGRLELPNVSVVDQYGCYIPNHPELTDKELQKIVKVVNAAMKGTNV